MMSLRTSTRPIVAAALVVSAAASAASAAIVETFSPTLPIASIDAQGDPSNVIRTYTAVGGYTLDRVLIPAATLSEVATTTFASEARIRMTYGSFAQTLQPFTTTSYVGTTSTTNYVLNVPNTLLPAGQVVSFEFFESGQDGAADLAEQNWTALSFQFDSFVPPSATNLGTLASGPTTVSGTLAAGSAAFYQFTLANDVNLGEFLDITTAGSNFDTEIAVYTAAGAFVDTDDDEGTTTSSALSYGSGSGADFDADPLFAAPSIGQDGFLTAGTYILALGGFNTAFGTTLGSDFSGVTPGTAGGAFSLNFNLGVIPEPTSIAAVAAGALILRRRR